MIKKYHLVIILVLYLSSCQDCFKSTGTTSATTRELPEFSTLIVEDNLDVVLKKSERPYVEIRSGKNLLNSIKTEVNNGTLTIDNKLKCNWVRNQSRDFIVTVHYTDLDVIEHLGYGNISAPDTLIFDALTLTILGQGDFILPLQVNNLTCALRRLGDFHVDGQVQKLNVFTFDHGYFYGKNLISKNCSANNSGEGNFEITVMDTLRAHIGREGDIIYYGNPVFVSETRDQRLGNGNLIKGN